MVSCVFHVDLEGETPITRIHAGAFVARKSSVPEVENTTVLKKAVCTGE